MDVIKKAIVDWLREILIGGIISNLSGMFDSVNEKVGEAIVEVGKSPSAWNSSIFNMVQNLSETVMISMTLIHGCFSNGRSRRRLPFSS